MLKKSLQHADSMHEFLKKETTRGIGVSFFISCAGTSAIGRLPQPGDNSPVRHESIRTLSYSAATCVAECSVLSVTGGRLLLSSPHQDGCNASLSMAAFTHTAPSHTLPQWCCGVCMRNSLASFRDRRARRIQTRDLAMGESLKPCKAHVLSSRHVRC